MTEHREVRTDIVATWLRFDDVECVRCRRWAGMSGDDCYVVPGEGMVCTRCITESEAAGARRG